MHDMFAQTDTRWAPWQVIDGNDKKAARIAALSRIATQLEQNVAMKPPDPDPDIVSLAESHLGVKKGT